MAVNASSEVAPRRGAPRARDVRAVRLRSPALLTLLALIVAFTSAADSRQVAPGYLSARAGGGLIVVDEPRTHPWSASFGSYTLCSTNGRGIRLQRVRHEASVRPVDVSWQLRTVDSPSFGIISVRGVPPDFVDPEHGTLLGAPGRYERLMPGRRITQSCAEAAAGDRGFTELLFVVEAAERGAVIDRAWIDYTFDGHEGHPYTLELHWQMVLCGVDVTRAGDDRGSCSLR
ncbi:hypothetical protein [Streptomyces mesophilus]|uniref:hypothetical protein n=1 Tax=Streptomyces mesophilus TaxID=1775132 RepID=UPI00332AE20A